MNMILPLNSPNNYLFYNTDATRFMKEHLKEGSVDLIIADPPYFEICGDFDFGVFKSVKEYVEWSRIWLKEVKRVLKYKGITYFFIDGVCHIVDKKCDLEEIAKK